MLRVLVAFSVVWPGFAVTGCKPRPLPPSPGDAAVATGATLVRCGATCAPGAPTTPSDGGELTIAVDAEPGTLCDLVEHDAWGRWIVENQVQETLLYQDPASGAIGPRLAARFAFADPKTLVLTLEPKVRWHDGAAFSSGDVAFTLGLARDPKIGADQAADLAPIVAVDTPDAVTVRLRLARPAPYLLQALAHLSILPAHLYRGRDLRTAPASRAPVGTGPFRFVEWQAGQRLILARHDGYWGRPAHLARVIFRFVRDKQVALTLYERGELDVLPRLPSPRAAEALLADPRRHGDQILAWTPRAYYYLVWNTQRGPLGKPEVRRALGALVDRARFMSVAFGGHAQPITGPYVPGTPSYDPAVLPIAFDPVAAKAALAAAGVSGLQLTFLATAGSRSAEQLATQLQEDFARAGVRLDIQTVDFATLLARLRKHDFDLSALQWTMSLEQDNFSMFHSSEAQGGQNYGAFSDPAVDRALEKIRATSDDTERHALDRALHRQLHQAQPYAFICSPEAETLVRGRVHDFRPSVDGFTLAEAWVQP